MFVFNSFTFAALHRHSCGIMKKTFPIITLLILISLLGLIFFQYLWLQTAKKIKEKQFTENVIRATAQAAGELVEGNLLLPPGRLPRISLPGSRLPQELMRPSVMQRFTTDEIRSIIKRALENNYLPNVDFEFAITQNSLLGDRIESNNFFKCYLDSLNHTRHIIPLTPPSGSVFENLAREEFLIIIVPNEKIIVLKELRWFIFGAILFTLIITTAFYLTIKTILRQKKLSEIKSDFINNMTHEFKTPLATISLAVDALKNEKVFSDLEKIKYYTGIIKDENRRMNKQVESILQAALLDKQKVELTLKRYDAHQLIQTALNNVSLPIEERGGTLEVNLKASEHFILADEVHFTNLINNLLDNAIKYSEDKLHIKLSTCNAGKMLKIKIEDEGIGMNKETLHRIFEKFYRAHTGNIHNVKGFGLGLSYVKTMVDAHDGQIKAESTPGKGSIFILQFPTVV